VSPNLDDKGFLQEKDRVTGGDPQPHLIVFAYGKTHIKQADLLENASM
jgi:hypothetical protein